MTKLRGVTQFGNAADMINLIAAARTESEDQEFQRNYQAALQHDRKFDGPFSFDEVVSVKGLSDETI